MKLDKFTNTQVRSQSGWLEIFESSCFGNGE